MRLDRMLVLAMLVPGVALALWLVLGAALVWGTLEAPDRAVLEAAIGPLLSTHVPVMLLAWWGAAAALGALVVRRLHAAYAAAPARLADAARVLIGDPDAPGVSAEGSAATRDLAALVNDLSAQRRTLRQDMERLVGEASRQVAQQRDQLGALVAELNQAVLVCNLDGRILLYNERARTLFRQLSRAPKGAAGAELIGLGRSIHAVIDRALIAHARESVERHLEREPDAAATARFVMTTPAGHLLRVGLSPVRPAEATGPALTGFVLLLDDITSEYEAQSRRDRQWAELMEASRASIASMQAALDLLDYPDLEVAERERFQAVVREEVTAMSGRLAAFAADASRELETRWPLQDMLGGDLISAAARRIAAETAQDVRTDAVDKGLWLSVDSFALIEALAFLAGRLEEALGDPRLELRLAPASGRAHLDLAWMGEVSPPEMLAGWQTAPIKAGEGASSLSVRDVVERHGGALWLEHDRAQRRVFFRFLLPLAAGEPMVAPMLRTSRPEFYDFDLFAASEEHREQDERALADIAYTVFDTETTGLDPANGDEIIQIGATRIVNGKMLRAECFDQLVDPKRSIPEAGIAIHHIRPEMVRGQPTIAEALPAFHAFVADTVLVGHNVAFDMRFLKLKEKATGAVFDQPVLDTLLLATVVHPNEESHGLEAIALRLGVEVSGRHTALGDAFTTAEVFLKLLPLLRQRGILTLGQAREAAQQSYYARLRY